MNFEPALWDGSDPSYAPCVAMTKGIPYWKAPAKYRKAGYKITSVRLHGDFAAKARELTREMVQWFEGDKPKVEPNTWHHLIARYKGDDVSPYQEVKANTRRTYADDLAYWEPVIGHMPIADMTFIEAKKIVRGMEAKGRSDHFIKAKFTMLRMLAGYGVALQLPGAREVKEVLGELRLKAPKPRTAAPKEAQIMAIIGKADAAGDTSFALGLLIQWRLTLRAIDVRGDYFPISGDDRSGICRGGQRWADGLTWDMIDRDITTLTKTPSKTRDKMPEALVFDLTLVPDLRARLQAAETRVGPVITDRHGMPYSRYAWSDMFRKYRAEAEVPDAVWMMDTRAGALNDARRKGADPLALQRQANHADFKTTQRYLREKSEGANNVLRIRAEQ